MLASYLQFKEVFDKNATSGVLSGLLSGVTYTFRLRARNLAGFSQPSNSQTCTIQDSSLGEYTGRHLKSHN